jgi:hypothetical protein
MNRILSCLNIVVMVVLTPAMLLAATDPTKIQEEMECIRHLDSSLSSGGIGKLFSTASHESIPAPKINSKYLAERISRREPVLTQLEQAKRAFGFKVTQALDRFATESQRQTTSEQRAKQATQLLDLADWFKAQKGYGNYILVTRCENLAIVPLGYLIADLTFPMEMITTLRKRITLRQDEREFRRTVLNSEAPKPFIVALAGPQSQQDDQMQMAWGNQWHAMADWFNARNVNIDKWRRIDLPEELAFFLDESPNGPKRASGSWEFDLHASLANGFRDKNIENVDAFAKYRELVGKFPTEPPKWWKADDKLYSKTKAAFEDAWLPYEEANGPIFGVAVIVYEQVTTGALMDSESLLEKLDRKAKP